MNNGPLLFFGIFLTLASSFWGLLLAPQLQIGQQQVTEIKETGELYPAPRSGNAQQGAEAYRSLGCGECHTRQVRSRNLGGDIERGWGKRRSVAQDYLWDYPVLLGELRTGPDLANAGTRLTNANEVLKLLYKPRSVNMAAMPAYDFLFEKKRLQTGETAGPKALQIEGEPAGVAIIPSEAAHALAAYILSLRADVSLFEAPLPPKPRPPEDTNAPPAGATNATPTPVQASPPSPSPAVPSK